MDDGEPGKKPCRLVEIQDHEYIFKERWEGLRLKFVDSTRANLGPCHENYVTEQTGFPFGYEVY